MPQHTSAPEVMASIDAAFKSSQGKPKKATAAAAATPRPTGPNLIASSAAVQQARDLVAAAHQSQAAYNQYQISNPRRNAYNSKNSAETNATKQKRSKYAIFQPIHSDEVMNAVRLLGSIDAHARAANGTLFKQFPPHNNTGDLYHRTGGKFQPRDSSDKVESRVEQDSFWIPNMEHVGTQPFGGNKSYVVYRSVRDFGAYGDGVTDDTAAINLAISSGNRCGQNCLSSSVKAAIIYFPLGTYRITSPIIMYYNTQLVGYIPAAGFTATIQVDPHFTGFGVITSDVYLPGGASEWYIEQSNFYRQIRNFDIDMTAATLSGINGIHWQVAQATSITNVNFHMSKKGSSTQIGIFAENGSGGWMSDLTFNGGQWGILAGNQQYTVARASFQSCQVAIGMIWDWGWTWSQLSIVDCDVGIDLAAPGATPGDPVGSLYLMDSSFTNTPTVIYTYPWIGVEKGITVITLDNIAMSGVDHVVLFSNGYQSSISTKTAIDFVAIGNVESNGETYGQEAIDTGARPTVLVDENGAFYAKQTWFSRAKPSYYQEPSSVFINAKQFATGDGLTDDTAAIQAILNYCAAQTKCILFFPAGSYIITSTIVIPINSYIVGEAWAQIVARGSTFADASKPTAAIVVGNSDGGTGTIEIQDLLFTSIGNLPGLVLMLWNAKASAIGSCAMWDSHFRVGGALGTDLQVAECAILSGGINSKCVAAFAMLVVETSGYFENVWAWVADHDLDDPQNTQVDVYGGRGILVQGDGPNWFWGTASEHSVLYQYGLVNASNVFMSMIQTESPYFQGSASTQAPLPFDQVVQFVGDPTWGDCGSATTSCNSAWAMVVDSSSGIFINGAAFYSWFQNYNQTCLTTSSCQQKMIYTYNSAKFWLNHVITVGVVEMITPASGNAVNNIVLASSNAQGTVKPWWSVMAVYLDSTAAIDTTAAPLPIKHGFVAFGDSYAAGIGTGNEVPDRTEKICYQGDQGYPWYLAKQFLLLKPDVFYRFYPCTGAVADDITSTNGQISEWVDTSRAELATLSIIGNDMGFAKIIKTCLIGYDKSGTCNEVLTSSEALLAAGNNDLDVLLYAAWRGILDKATLPRFIIYQTGYPQFFETLDYTCDKCRFWVGVPGWSWSGEYLTIPLRDRLNALSQNLNTKIHTLINQWNARLPRPQIVFVEPDLHVYPGHRFCEVGIEEPQSGDAQNTVAFFYSNGQDVNAAGADVPSNAGGWPAISYNSGTCQTQAADWSDEFLCQTAIDTANNDTLKAEISQLEEVAAAAGDTTMTIVVNSDGSVTVTDYKVGWLKMFHPKSLFNKKIALEVYNEVVRHATSA